MSTIVALSPREARAAVVSDVIHNLNDGPPSGWTLKGACGTSQYWNGIHVVTPACESYYEKFFTELGTGNAFVVEAVVSVTPIPSGSMDERADAGLNVVFPQPGTSDAYHLEVRFITGPTGTLRIVLWDRANFYPGIEMAALYLDFSQAIPRYRVRVRKQQVSGVEYIVLEAEPATEYPSPNNTITNNSSRAVVPLSWFGLELWGAPGLVWFGNIGNQWISQSWWESIHFNFCDDKTTLLPVWGGTAPDPPSHLTARATDGGAYLEWVIPTDSYGIWLCESQTSLLAWPCSGAQKHDLPGYVGAFVNNLTNGQTTYFTAFTLDAIGLPNTTGRGVTARPFSTPTQVKWAYSTGATSLAPPGVLSGAVGAGGVYAVSNDNTLHAVNPTASGGTWPRTAPFSWLPLSMNGPAQGRPPVIQTSAVAGASAVVFVGSQDGRVYAVDAHSGAQLWQSPQLGDMIQAGVSGMFTSLKGAHDLLFVGTRNSASNNALVALDPSDGSVAWTFTDGGGMGFVSSTASVDYANKRVYFTSRAGSNTGTVWGLSFSGTGATKLWSKALGHVDAAPTLIGGRLYVGTNAGTLHALDPSDGEDLWAPTPSFATADGAVKGGVWPEVLASPRRLFFSTTKKVWAVTDQGTSAALSWSKDSVSAPSMPLLHESAGLVYVGSDDGALHALSTSNGSTQSAVTLGDGKARVGSPSYDHVNSLLYAGTEAGVIYAVSMP